jgi:hypothetical protein
MAARLVSQACHMMNRAVMIPTSGSTHSGGIPTWRLILSGFIVGFGGLLVCLVAERKDGSERTWVLLVGAGCYLGGALFGLAPWGKVNSNGQHYCRDKGWFHFANTVTQQYSQKA